MGSNARRLWSIQEQISAYQSMKRRTFWSKLFLLLLAAAVIAPVITIKYDWIIGQIVGLK